MARLTRHPSHPLPLDEDVVRLLRTRQDTIKRVLSEFEQRLVTVARAELPDVDFTDLTDGSPCFTYRGETWTTGWPLADEMRWQFFRLSDGNLAQELVATDPVRIEYQRALAGAYENQGSVFEHKKNCRDARASYEKALHIFNALRDRKALSAEYAE